jgi:hypothetical protein
MVTHVNPPGSPGIRFHLVIAALLLVIVTITIAVYSITVTERIARQANAEERELLSAVARGRAAFEATASLGGLLDGLVNADTTDERQLASRRAREQIDKIDVQLDSLAAGLAALAEMHAGFAASPEEQVHTSLAAQVGRPARLLDDLRAATHDLDRQVQHWQQARLALAGRGRRIETAQREHIAAASRVEVTLRALVSRALAIDLAAAAAESRLQRRIDDILEMEFS